MDVKRVCHQKAARNGAALGGAALIFAYPTIVLARAGRRQPGRGKWQV